MKRRMKMLRRLGIGFRRRGELCLCVCEGDLSDLSDPYSFFFSGSCSCTVRRLASSWRKA